MFGDIEQLVLSGGLFNGQSRSSSPTRTPSPDGDGAAQWPPGSPSAYTDKELFGGSDNDSEPESKPGAEPQHESIGMGPGRTGVKGVIRDRAEHDARVRAARQDALRAHNAKLEKSALLARPYAEPDDDDDKSGGRLTERFGRFGHLREVGAAGFVAAVEGEARGTWVVVHIYDEGLDRCSRLDSALIDLARRHPQTKFLRARAAALGFASLSAGKASSKAKAKAKTTKIGALDSDSEDDSEDRDSDADDDVDVDMLPTLLVYRDGDLVHNWVRVDWEVKIDDIEELLSKHNIIQTVDRPLVRSDDEDD